MVKAAEQKDTVILAKGVDSLYLYLSEGLNFAGLLEIGESLDFEQEISLQGLTFSRSRAYIKTYPVSLRSGFFVFFVNRVSCYVQVSSLAFEMRGFEGTVCELCGVLDKLAGKRRSWLDLLRVSRVDVYTDFTFEGDFNPEQFKTKLRTWGIMASGQDEEAKTYYFGDRRRFVVRLYVKSSEIEVSGKSYLAVNWREQGAAGEKVWRLEFEYRRERLAALGERCLSNFDKDYLQALFGWGIDSISYMAREANHRHLNREKLHPVWEALRAALYRDYSLQKPEVKKANLEYRFKVSRKYVLSYCGARFETFEEIPEHVRRLFALDKVEWTKAKRAFDLFEWD